MLSLQRLRSKSDRFFDLLEASAEEAHRAVHALVDMLAKTGAEGSLDELILTRRQTKRIAEDMTSLLCATFVTPLEREDIEELFRALYKIPKGIEKFCERLSISRAYLTEGFFQRQAKLLEQATNTVCQMVRQRNANRARQPIPLIAYFTAFPSVDRSKHAPGLSWIACRGARLLNAC